MNENLNKMIADSEGIVTENEPKAAVTPDTAPDLSEEVKAALAARRGEAIPGQAVQAEESFADRFAEREERENLRERIAEPVQAEAATDRFERVIAAATREMVNADSPASIYNTLDRLKDQGVEKIGGVAVDELRSNLDDLVAASEKPANERLTPDLLKIIAEKGFPIPGLAEKVAVLVTKNSEEKDAFDAREQAARQQGFRRAA